MQIRVYAGVQRSNNNPDTAASLEIEVADEDGRIRDSFHIVDHEELQSLISQMEEAAEFFESEGVKVR